METQRMSRSPFWGLMFVVVLNHLLTPCICVTLPSITDLHSELEADDYVALVNSKTHKTYTDTAFSQNISVVDSKASGDLRLENKSSASQTVNNKQTSSAYGEENAASTFTTDVLEGVGRTPPGPSLFDGGGIAGVIRRVVGLVPMLASRLTSRLGLSRRRRELTEKESATPADHLLPYQHLEIIKNLNKYYSSLNNSTKAKDRPTLEQLKAHREYLLHLLQQMKHNNKSNEGKPDGKWTKHDNSSDNGKILLQKELKNFEHNSLISYSRNVTSVSQNESENKGNRTKEQYTSAAHDVDVKNTSLVENIYKEKEENNPHFSSRVGQVMSDHSDIQTEDVDKVALLLHQFQTQGDVSLLPNNFLEKLSSMAKNPIRRYNLFQTTPPAFTQKPANTKLKLPSLSQMEQQSRPNAINLENDSPLSLLQTALKGGNRPSNLESAAGDNVPIPNLLAEPSHFSELSTLSDDTKSVFQAMDEPPLLPAVNPVAPSIDTINFQGPNNMDLVRRPIANLPGFQNGLPLTFLGSAIPSGPANLDSLPEEDLPPLSTLGILNQFPDFGPPANSILGNNQITEDPNVVIVDAINFQDIGPLGVPLSSVAFNASDVVPATFQNTRITNELTTALTNFINNLATAIGQLFTDLQAALNANPMTVLLLLLPLLLLPFLFNHGGGKSGYGHRRVFIENPHSKIMTAERLAQKILSDIDHYERLFMNDKNRYLRK